MKDLFIYFAASFILGFIFGCVITYSIIKQIKKWRKEDEFIRDSINNL